jgi:hypothetical protein
MSNDFFLKKNAAKQTVVLHSIVCRSLNWKLLQEIDRQMVIFCLLPGQLIFAGEPPAV